MEGGFVTGVSLMEQENEDGWGIYMSKTQGQVMTLALAGADRRFHCFNFQVWEWTNAWEGWYGTYETCFRGFRMGERLDISGYEGLTEVRVPIEGEEHSYSRAVYVERLPE